MKKKLDKYVMNNKFIMFIVFLFLISCSTQYAQNKLPLDGDYYIIDLDKKKEPAIYLSSLFKNVRTIILETNDDCIIGGIDDIQVFDGYIYILDQRKTKRLFVFDMEGRFIRSIGSVGAGPGEYIEIRDFTFDKKNNIIFLCDHSNRIHKYKLDGTYMHTIKMQLPNTDAERIQFYDGNLYISSIIWENATSSYMLQEIDPSDGRIISRSIPIEYNKGWKHRFHDQYSRLFMSRANNPPRYNKMFMNYIVSIGKEIAPYIELKSRHLTTEEDMENFEGKDRGPLNFLNLSNSSKIFNVRCFVENDDFILFRIGASSSFSALLNKKTKETKLANNLYNDLIYKKDEPLGLGRFMFSDARGAYDLLYTQIHYILNEFQRSIKNNEIVPDLDKLDQLKKLNEDSNPVIFFYEFKDL